MRRESLAALLAARAAKRPVVLVTDLESGDQRLEYGDEIDAGTEDPTAVECRQALRDDRSRTVETPDGTLFFQVFNSPLRMLVVGAVHITQVLAPMAGLAGYDVTVIDPRRSFASDDRFPNVAVATDWPDEALERLAPDSRTAVITLTHDPKLDDPALQVALRSEAFYIGSLGSRKTHSGRVERLTEAGLDASAIARIHGPIGLPLGAKSPAEIAVSILAQVTETLRRGEGA